MTDLLADFQEWLDATPFQQLLGLQAVALAPEQGTAIIRLPYHARLARRHAADEFHGGAIAALIDVAAAGALFALRGFAGPTIDMRVDYLRLAATGELLAESRALKAGRSLAVIDVTVRDGEGQSVAVGRVAYSTAKVHIAGESRRRRG